jgi:hypothetical protein
MQLLGIIIVDCDITEQLMITYSEYVITEKNREHKQAVCQSFTDFKKAYDLVTRKVWYNIFSESGTPIKSLS